MVIVKKSLIGQGLFAQRDLATGKLILKIKGKLVKAEVQAEQSGPLVDNSFRYGPNTYLQPQGQLGDFLNHSCEPNCGVKKIGKSLWIIAITNIPRGKEITIDYSTIIAADDVWKMSCDCKAKSCRKIIGKFKHLPRSLKRGYLNRGVVPRYIYKTPA